MKSHFPREQRRLFFKGAAVVLSLIIVSLSLASCKSVPVKTTYSLVAENDTENALMLIVNNPKEEVISKVEISKSITLNDKGVRFLVIPKYADSVIEIFKLVRYGVTFEHDERVYFNPSTPENYVLDVYAERNDNPMYEIVIRTQTQFARYYLKAVSGSEGEESFEYIESENAGYTEADKFSAGEIDYISFRGTDYIKGIYGHPSDVVTFEKSDGMTATRIFYDNTFFEVSNVDSHIYHAVLFDENIPIVRGVEIGDGLPKVTVKFPNESDSYTSYHEGRESEIPRSNEEEASYSYQLLYGFFGVRQYGYIRYDANEVVTQVVYADGDCSVVFNIKNNRVSSIEYKFEA